MHKANYDYYVSLNKPEINQGKNYLNVFEKGSCVSDH